ncbi:VENN motif pre-toxin domain-containing protein, partial [Hydrogenophaga sp. 5NK40-0174]|uniref:VENN motif pre-toxin domain-containing protein n=1 Tax=Hydrogenophaga sp. 5NK40-0174 TaxID=3127649 RepID=UPI00310842CE
MAYGGSFGENLLNAGMNAGFDKLGEGFAGHIGKQNLNGALTDLQAELAHAALGCGLGMVRSGNGKGCAAGAAGAVVAHSLADDVKTELKDEDSTLSSIFKAVPGKTINENTVFITGLAGSVAGGVGGALAGDTTRDLQANMNMGQITGSNAVANNFLKHEDANKLKKEVADCRAKTGGCSVEAETAIRDKYIDVSNKNIDEVNRAVIAGDPDKVANLLSQAAQGYEVSNVFSLRNDEALFVGRQNNVNWVGSTRGDAAMESDVQLASDIREFRQENCSGKSSAACDGLVNDALDDRAYRAAILGVVSAGIPLVARLPGAIARTPRGPRPNSNGDSTGAGGDLIEHPATPNAANSSGGSEPGVPYFRVQGGGSGTKTSRDALSVSPDGKLTITPGCTGAICVSAGSPDHAVYYITERRQGGQVVVFEVDQSTHRAIMGAKVPQKGNARSPVKVVDESTSGNSVSLELDEAYSRLMADHSSRARVMSQEEFLREFGNRK